MLKALIFDVDGTLAETEDAHRAAFNRAFVDVGLSWHWSVAQYKDLLKISGGKERILYHWRKIDAAQAKQPDAQRTIEKLHALKTQYYEQLVSGGQLPLRIGVLSLMQEAQRRGLKLAIATTTTPANIDALLKTHLGSAWREKFAVIEDASTAPQKKPHPQVYLQALKRLGLEADETLAFEDSENGLNAAVAAGIPTVITPNAYTEGQDFSSAKVVLDDLSGAPHLLAQWMLELH